MLPLLVRLAVPLVAEPLGRVTLAISELEDEEAEELLVSIVLVVTLLVDKVDEVDMLLGPTLEVPLLVDDEIRFDMLFVPTPEQEAVETVVMIVVDVWIIVWSS